MGKVPDKEIVSVRDAIPVTFRRYSDGTFEVWSGFVIYRERIKNIIEHAKSIGVLPERLKWRNKNQDGGDTDD